MGKTITGGERAELQASLEGLIRERVRETMEAIVAEELEAALGAGRSERSRERQGYRHGARARTLTLRSGTVRLEVPRGRLVDAAGGEQEWQSQLLPRYWRCTPEVEQAVTQAWLAGTNTRRIRSALRPLLEQAPLSKSTVSRLLEELERDYLAWQSRPLTELPLRLLYLDAIYFHLRRGGSVVSTPVLVALGVLADGEKVLLGLQEGGAESTEAWQGLLGDLTRRGLRRPELVVTDGNPGLEAAVENLWPAVRHQRCTVHKLRNLARRVPRHLYDELRDEDHAIVSAADRAEALAAREQFLKKWDRLAPGVARSLREAGDRLLTFYGFPPELWVAIRTTNCIERLQQEFRRRVQSQSVLPSETSLLKLLFGLFQAGQIKMRKIKGFRSLPGGPVTAS